MDAKRNYVITGSIMGILDYFKNMTGRNSKNDHVIETPYGKLNLARTADRRRVQKIVAQLQRTTDALTRKDMADWRHAWQWAINIDNPNRQRLYDIYRDVDVDLHLSGCVEQRKGFVMARAFKIEDASGNVNDEAHHYFDQAWFK